MSKKPKKWNKWIEYLGDDIPVWGDEKVKLDVSDGVWIGASEYGDWASASHYKRLLSNVEAERVARIKNEIDWKTVEENAAWEDAAPDIHESARHDPDARTSKPSTKFDGPKPIITGPGEYMTAIGLKAVIDHLGFNTPWAATGTINTVIMSWNQWGACRTHNLDYHITGPWEEPKTEKPERWANLYFSDGVYGLGLVRASSKEGCLRRTSDSLGKHIGAVLLSHTEGEE